MARPDPAIVAVPVESAAQYQTDPLHFNTSPVPQPPTILRPVVVTSRPELDDVIDVVPVVSASIVM